MDEDREDTGNVKAILETRYWLDTGLFVLI